MAIGTAACWGAFVVTWSLGAALEKLRAPSVARRRRDYATWAAVVAAAAIVSTPQSLWRWLVFDPSWVRVAGVAVLVLATAYALWARLSLGLMWSSRVVIRRDHVLRTSGPYAITRHPIYTGMLLMFAGTTLALGFGRWTVLFAVLAIALTAKANIEEELLSSAFPAEYAQYRQRVPALIPRPRWTGHSRR